MNCPHCNVALLMTERQGIEIDYCPQCRGVWLDRGELDKILERSHAELVSTPVGVPTAPEPRREERPRYDDDREEVDFGEISVFIAPTFVITVRQGVASELHSARTNLEAHPRLLAEGSPAVLWAILDQVIKSYGPVVAELERDIEEVESTVFAGEAAPTERIYFLRREVTNFHRAVHPLLTVLTTIERANREGPLAPYFHDVHDYLRLISDEVAAQRDLLATILEANMAVISVEQTRLGVRQGQTIERLTILATIFLPLTFVTGFFGQNFSWLVEQLDGLGRFLVLGIGGLLVPLVVLWLLLRRDRDRAG